MIIKAPLDNLFFIKLKTGSEDMPRSQSKKATEMCFIELLIFSSFKVFSKNPLIIFF